MLFNRRPADRPFEKFTANRPAPAPAPRVRRWRVVITFGADGERDQFSRLVYALDREAAFHVCLDLLAREYGAPDAVHGWTARPVAR